MSVILRNVQRKRTSKRARKRVPDSFVRLKTFFFFFSAIDESAGSFFIFWEFCENAVFEFAFCKGYSCKRHILDNAIYKYTLVKFCFFKLTVREIAPDKFCSGNIILFP